MLRTSALNFRVNAVEAYIGMTEDSTGMTVTARLDAHHRLLRAHQATQADMLRRLSAIEALTATIDERLARTEAALTDLVARTTEIKNGLHPRPAPQRHPRPQPPADP